jgi:hypothetical protein
MFHCDHKPEGQLCPEMTHICVVLKIVKFKSFERFPTLDYF